MSQAQVTTKIIANMRLASLNAASILRHIKGRKP